MEHLDKTPYYETTRHQQCCEHIEAHSPIDICVPILNGRVHGSNVTTAVYRTKSGHIQLDAWQHPTFWCRLDMSCVIAHEVEKHCRDVEWKLHIEKEKNKQLQSQLLLVSGGCKRHKSCSVLSPETP